MQTVLDTVCSLPSTTARYGSQLCLILSKDRNGPNKHRSASRTSGAGKALEQIDEKKNKGGEVGIKKKSTIHLLQNNFMVFFTN